MKSGKRKAESGNEMVLNPEPLTLNTEHASSGPWVLTYTGKQFFPLTAQPEDVCIEDIAHHLSLLCRFNGGCREFYSVAQHSVHVAQLLPDRLKLHGLLHDAPEAYLGDMVSPLKALLSAYRHIEGLLWPVICRKFKLPKLKAADRRAVKTADGVLLATEWRDLMPAGAPPLSRPEPPWRNAVQPWTAELAERQFLNLYHSLTQHP